MRTFTFAVATSLSMLLTACDQKPKDNQTVTINGNGGNLTISGNDQHFTMKADDGKSSFEINGAGANVNMPAFAPLYPGAKITASMSAASKDGKGGMVSFETSAGGPAVIAFYKAKASAYGMTDNLDSSANGNLMFVATANERKKSLQVVASNANSGSNVQVTWSGN